MANKLKPKEIDLKYDPDSITFETPEEYRRLFEKYNSAFIEKTKMIEMFEDDRQKIVESLKAVYNKSITFETQEKYDSFFEEHNSEFIKQTTMMQKCQEERHKIIEVLKTLYQNHRVKFGPSEDNEKTKSISSNEPIYSTDDNVPDSIVVTI
jgi:hypothetical protein